MGGMRFLSDAAAYVFLKAFHSGEWEADAASRTFSGFFAVLYWASSVFLTIWVLLNRRILPIYEHTGLEALSLDSGDPLSTWIGPGLVLLIVPLVASFFALRTVRKRFSPFARFRLAPANLLIVVPMFAFTGASLALSTRGWFDVLAGAYQLALFWFLVWRFKVELSDLPRTGTLQTPRREFSKTDKALMRQHGIGHNGRYYIVGDMHFDHLHDAIAHARRLTKDGV